MNSSTWIYGLWILGIIAISGDAHGDTIAFQPGLTYSTVDPRNESLMRLLGSLPLRSNPVSMGGLSVMPMLRQLDPVQVNCDSDPTCSYIDITRQLHWKPQEQRPSTIDQSNSEAVPSLAITPPLGQGLYYWQQPQPGNSFSSSQPQFHSQSQPHPQSDASLRQPVSWPSSSSSGGGGGGSGGSGGGSIGLFFFVPQSASHLPVEQLIRQQLALHRTQLPIDISINCEDAVGVGCGSRPAVGGLSTLPILPAAPPQPSAPSAPPATAVNERNAENGNYASLPLDGVDSGGRRGGFGSSEQNRKRRTTTGVRQQQGQQQQELSILP